MVTHLCTDPNHGCLTSLSDGDWLSPATHHGSTGQCCNDTTDIMIWQIYQMSQVKKLTFLRTEMSECWSEIVYQHACFRVLNLYIVQGLYVNNRQFIGL